MELEGRYPRDLEVAIGFHGHVCPGLIIGYRAAKAVQNRLHVERSGDEDLVTIVESDGCGIDGIQSILGCTIGKGNLIYKDHGKQVCTAIDRKKNKAVRVAMKEGAFPLNPEQQELFRKIGMPDVSDEDMKAFRAFQKERVEELLRMGEDELFKIEYASPEVPGRARIFRSVTCHYCGEPVMEPRAGVRDGKPACIPCSESYTRGW